MTTPDFATALARVQAALDAVRKMGPYYDGKSPREFLELEDALAELKRAHEPASVRAAERRERVRR